MKYPNGQDVRLGDKVKWHGVSTGIVVASVDTDEYSDFCQKDTILKIYKQGIAIKFEKKDLLFLPKYDANLEFVERGEVPVKQPYKKMTYIDGQEVHIGDRVSLPGSEGIVVCSIDNEEYTNEHPKEQWGYLGRGCMIEFKNYGLIHYEEAEEDLVLIERTRPKKDQ